MDLNRYFNIAAAIITSLLSASCSNIENKISPARKPTECRQPEEQPAALSGSYIVAFKTEPGVSTSGFSSFASESRAHYRFLDSNFLPENEVASIQFITSIDLSEGSGGAGAGIFSKSLLREPWSLSQERAASIARVDFHNPEEATKLLETWEKDGKVWFYEPNYISQLSTQDPAPTNTFGALKTKYESLNYWWLKSINVVQAYESLANRDQTNPVFRTDENINSARPIIAVLDSGVDYQHPALSGRIWVNNDVNESSCENDIHGCDTTVAKKGKLGNGNVYPFDTNGPGESCFGKSSNCSHGTHVAGIIAGDYEWADPELSRRAAGVCPVCQIMILKIVGKVGKDSGILDSSILSAFKYVSLFRREGSPAVRVINASFGKFVRSRSVGLLVRILKDRHGAVVIGASGNEDSMSMEYPAAFSDAIAVAAVDEDHQKVDFSNFGRWVDISAPGDGILSTVPGASLDVKSGTSMAAPMVSGVAGLLVAQKQNLPFSELRGALLNAADPTFYQSSPTPTVNSECYYIHIKNNPIRQPLLGLGLLNARDSINNALTPGQPIFSKLDRVKPGCSVVGSGMAAQTTGYVWLLLPVLIIFYRRFRF
jgi:hypothetical protein